MFNQIRQKRIIFNMGGIVRAVKLKLDLPYEIAERTVRAWTDACNLVSRIAFNNGKISNAVRLQSLAYETARSTGLSAQVAVSCIRHVASQYAAVRSNKHTIDAPCTFRQQTVVLQGGKRGRDVSLRANGLSIWTLDGRLNAVPFYGPPGLDDKLNNWTLGDGRLFFCRKAKTVFLALSFKKDVEARTAPNDAVVGMDRGINVLATVTNGHGEKLLGGRHIKHVQRRYNKTRASLQKKLSEHKKARKDTRSVRRVLKRLSGRERRFQRNENHRISRRIVDYAASTGNSAIAIEDLGGIREGRKLRKEQRTDLNRWAFYKLEQFVTYKAETLGMAVIAVDAKHSSQGCSKCGHTERANRNRHVFRCKACGHTLHADVNAAHNLRLRGILARQACAGMGLRQ